MNLKEKIAETHPDCIIASNEDFRDGVKDCPDCYPETRYAPNCDTGLKSTMQTYSGICVDCWSQEWKEEYQEK